MPLYHFQFISKAHSADGGELYLPDDDAARLEAEVEASELLRHPGEGDWSKWTIRVTNEAGRLVATVAVAEMRTRAA